MTTSQVPDPPPSTPTPSAGAEPNVDWLTAEPIGLPLGALNERLGVEFLAVSVNRLVARMPVEGNTQPMGLLHGGASVVLAESLGSIGAFLHAKTVWPDGVPSAVGIEINATHHRSARSGSVIGVATPVHLGRTLATFQVSISQAETGKLLCTCRITCLLRPAAAAES